MAKSPSINGAIKETEDNSESSAMTLDTGNPLQMIAGITSIVQSVTRITIDWTYMEDGQGFYIWFSGEDGQGQLLHEIDAFGLITQYLQVAADYLHSPWMPIVMITAPVLLMIALYNQIQETYF